MLLKELAQPQSYKPTEHERAALSIVSVSDTPQMAQMQISRNEKLNYAVRNLVDMGFIQNTGGGYTVTDNGRQLSISQALSDELGQPSEQASELASNYEMQS